MKATVRPATYADCVALAPRVRACDAVELAVTGESPLTALLESVRLSTSVWAADYDGEVQVIFGVAPSFMRSGEGSPWLLASERVSDFTTQFLRESRRYIPRMHADFPTLRNYVHSLNRASILWLIWCGFKFPRVVRVTPTDLFIEFEKTTCATQSLD